MNQCSSNSSYFPKAKKTGTTIAGIIFKDGVVLGADTRATEVKLPCFLYSICPRRFVFYGQTGENCTFFTNFPSLFPMICIFKFTTVDLLLISKFCK